MSNTNQASNTNFQLIPLDQIVPTNAKERQDNGMDVFTAISLCSGYEGLGLGLKRAIPNVRTVCYVEREVYAVCNLVAKIQKKLLDDAPIWDDLATFDPEPYKGMVHIIHGGYPCQSFSVAGKRLGTKDPRWVWPYIARIVETIRPVWCIFENVAGHLSLGFPEVYCSLRNMGYSVEAGLFTAAEVGAPHKRQRLFIMAKSKRRCRGRGNGEPAGQGRALQIEGSGQLDNTKTTERWRLSEKYAGRGIEETGRPDGSQLADSNGTGCEEQRRAEPIRQEYIPVECGGTRWPARPGQPQYEWEEPRVVAHAIRVKRRSGTGTGRISKGNNEIRQGQTQSGVGGATNGTSCRVDRLRLLGNGVVPQCAEKAIRVLGALFGRTGCQGNTD